MKRKISNTCIAVLKHRGKLYFGADRRASWGFDQAQSMPRPKVVKRSGVILAGTGDGALCGLIVDIMDIPEVYKDSDMYMNHDFYYAVRKILLQKGFADEHKLLKIPGDMSAQIVVGVNHRCYIVDIQNMDSSKDSTIGSITIDEVNLPYGTGCGGQWAWGVIDCLQDLLEDKINYIFPLGYSPKSILLKALQTAAKYSPGCDGIFDIVSE